MNDELNVRQVSEWYEGRSKITDEMKQRKKKTGSYYRRDYKSDKPEYNEDWGK